MVLVGVVPLLLLTLLGFSIIGAVSSEPVIKPDETELIISRGDNYTLECISDNPITWTYTEDELRLEKRGYIHNSNYVSTITLNNATASDVGFYTCSELRNEYSYLFIYVYVEDDTKIYVGQTKAISVTAVRNAPLVIPCRPTSPNVIVKLYERNGRDTSNEVRMNEKKEDGTSWKYDPKKGFILSKMTNKLTYMCTFRKKDIVEVPVRIDLKNWPSRFYNLIIHGRNNGPFYREGENIELACRLVSELTPTFTWKFNGTELKTDGKYTISVNDPYVYKIAQFSKLIIHNISKYMDSGKYTCQAYDGFKRDEYSQNVNNIISNKELRNSFYFKVVNSSKCIETCKSIVFNAFLETFPTAEIRWFNNRGEEISNDGKYRMTRPDESITLKISNVTLEDRGNYTLNAKNVEIEENRTIFLNVEGKPTARIISSNFHLKNENERLECKVRGYPKPQINWTFKSCMDCQDIPIKSNESEDGEILFISVAVMKSNQSGYVQCHAKNRHGEDLHVVDYILKDPEAPSIVSSNMEGLEHEWVYPNPYNFTCNYDGFPLPHVEWYKDNQTINPDNRIKLHNKNQTLEFTWTEESDEGKYSCLVKNRIDSDERTASVVFTNKRNVNPIYIVLVVIALLLLIFCIGLIVRVIKKQEFKRALRRAGLLNFEKGAMESINPDLTIHDQANLLPYDREKWEISKHHIKLGQQLGAGQFGVVMKGSIERYNYCTKYIERLQVVAIKMINNSTNDAHLRALVSELKIMAYLGKHLNVVNLIGAWTKHIAKRKLYVIVEYCRYGNLHDYLIRHRENFINQIDPVTEKIDYKIGADILESEEEVYREMTDFQNNSTDNSSAQTTGYAFVNKEYGANYGDDYKESTKHICTKDLVTWAYQVSSGMEYLVSRKILHGDLAARNILLASDNIVKISDFGLSKNMYQSDYKKKEDVRLPIKWMSVEAIRDRIFSVESDVWSFGIVLWEFFSLAETPYPGMEADERLLKKLMDGYRMDCPPYATEEIYAIILNCWESKPLDRPSFEQLSERIGNSLEESVKKYYIDLNMPYIDTDVEGILHHHNN